MSPPPSHDAPTLASPEQTRWFTEKVHPHEGSLRSYLRGAFPSVGDVDDVVQESYLRTFRARTTQPIRCARAFLFTVARRLALDTLRHDRASPIERVDRIDALPVIDERCNVAEDVGRRERISLLGDAISDLPARCREVFILHKIKGLSRKETAAQLGLAERSVEIQTANAVRRCAAYLRRRGVTGLFDHEAR
jgi:RNA polymerase sigma-70 factor (ECF subfamily)